MLSKLIGLVLAFAMTGIMLGLSLTIGDTPVEEAQSLAIMATAAFWTHFFTSRHDHA